MQYLNAFLSKIRDRGSIKLAESILKTASEIGEKHIKEFSFISHEIGLLFGNVQSGKTGQMFGIMCKAADLGFPAFVLLTTDNAVLQQQTLERAKADLDGFCICGENDSRIFVDNNLVLPVIIVLKKNARVLRLWANIFASTGLELDCDKTLLIKSKNKCAKYINEITDRNASGNNTQEAPEKPYAEALNALKYDEIMQSTQKSANLLYGFIILLVIYSLTKTARRNSVVPS